ncbi:hypothetical protein [Pseudomonas sp. MPB26]|uniref:hypothetical protein n=1 Tax=Pseudomonas sp. MPB26 TaxID=3388491 RepID=UPI003984CFEE
MGMLSGLFKHFFNRLQTLLGADVRPPESKRDGLPVPAPRVQPAPDTAVIDKQSEPIPELSNKRNGAKPDHIWNGFRQGKDGNCVTISAIKAAMAKFGQSPTDIYTSVKKVSEGYEVVMRDGFKLTLTMSELDRAIRSSNFVALNDNEMLKDAHFLFACSVKRAQIENNDGWASRSFEAAIRTLNDGEDESGSGEGFKRLGLKSYMENVSVGDFADRSLIGMVNPRGHSVAVVDGSEEIYGKRGGRPKHGQAVALL